MENSIIEELYNARSDDFETSIMERDKECNKDLYKVIDILEELIKIVPKKNKTRISKIQDDIFHYAVLYSSAWNRKYYRFGIQDGMKLKQEIKTKQRKRKENEKNFIIDYESDFNDFFENYKVKFLYKNEEYLKIINEISEILDKYPKLRYFYEDNKIDSFNKDELKILLKFIDLNDSRNSFEVRTAFKLGMTQESII